MWIGKLPLLGIFRLGIFLNLLHTVPKRDLGLRFPLLSSVWWEALGTCVGI